MGIEKGRAEELLQVVCSLLARRFGVLPSAALEQLQGKSVEQLRELLVGMLDAPSLEALGLQSTES